MEHVAIQSDPERQGKANFDWPAANFESNSAKIWVQYQRQLIFFMLKNELRFDADGRE